MWRARGSSTGPNRLVFSHATSPSVWGILILFPRGYGGWPYTPLRSSGLEVVRLLNRLDVSAGDIDGRIEWQNLLVEVIRSPMGENLTSHCWRLLGELVSTESSYLIGTLGIHDVEVIRLLEEAEDWEKLEVWMAVVWKFARHEMTPEWLEIIGDVTLKLLLLRPSAIQRFGRQFAVPRGGPRAKFSEVLDRARVEGLASDPQHQHPPYVSVHSSLFLSVLTPPFPPSRQLALTQPPVPLHFAGDDTF